jgi:hypothetical protein
LHSVGAQLLVKPFQERQSVLAGGAIDFEEGGKDRTSLQSLLQRVTLAVNGSQLEVGR